MEKYHTSVMAKEAIEHLKVNTSGKYIDCTLGDGGHTIEILRKGGTLLGIDLDQNAIDRANLRLLDEGLTSGFILTKGNFKDLVEIANANGFNPCDGILYDLGTSYLQLEDKKRGFSFNSDAPLDMRMDQSEGVTAKDLVNVLPERELARIIFDYGGERYAKRIAKAIVKDRKEKVIEFCSELAKLISTQVVKTKGLKIHPATRTFQALRIAVNEEGFNLSHSLSRAAGLLKPSGRLVIISFHSLEDKIAKTLRPSLREVLDEPQAPSLEEVSKNPRSRSAKLRVYEKI